MKLSQVAGASTLTISVFFAAALSTASALEKVSLTLSWVFGGANAPILLAVDRGYFAAGGVDLAVAAGNGSANVVTRVASGAFKVGIGDTASIIKFNTLNPDRHIKALYSQTPADLAIVTLKGRGITKPADLKLRTVGAPLGDATYKLFPAFSAATGVSESDIKWEHMSPTVREAMLIQGKVDAITANESTAYFALKSAGVKDEDIIFIRYSDFAPKLMGTGIMSSEAFIKAKPDLVRAIVAGVNRGWTESIADPKAAIDALARREPLLKRDIELGRLQYFIRAMTSRADAQAEGLGFYSEATAAYNIDLISNLEKLPSKIDPSDLIDMGFLPPRSERGIPKNTIN